MSRGWCLQFEYLPDQQVDGGFVLILLVLLVPLFVPLFFLLLPFLFFPVQFFQTGEHLGDDDRDRLG